MLIKCYAERHEDLWVAVCINFNLAAQAHTFEEAKDNLSAQIEDHIEEALSAPEPIRHQLLYGRKAPLVDRLRYHLFGVLARLAEIAHAQASRRIFSEDRPAIA